MTRPTIDHLFDHSIRIWRPTVSKDGVGAESRSYTLQVQTPCTLNRSVAPVAPVTAGGLAPVGRRRFYVRTTVSVRVRDIIELVSGPDAHADGQLTWEVDEPPVVPKGHHKQLDCVEWHGVLPEVEES